MAHVHLPDGFELLATSAGVAGVRSSVKPALVALGILERSVFERTRRAGELVGRGRGRVVAVPLGGPGGGRAVIRHCRRAGPLAKLLGDIYFTRWRPLRELCAAEAARTAGVPTPEPLAALVWKRGPVWSGDLMVREVPDAVPLEAWLRRRPDATPGTLRPILDALAAAFAKLFAANVYHPDLHAGNVLVQQRGRPVLHIIDFDRARQLPALPRRLRDKMLFRFNRALLKRRLSPRPVTRTNRLRLCERLGVTGDRAETRRFLNACEAHLRWHAWRY